MAVLRLLLCSRHQTQQRCFLLVPRQSCCRLTRFLLWRALCLCLCLCVLCVAELVYVCVHVCLSRSVSFVVSCLVCPAAVNTHTHAHQHTRTHTSTHQHTDSTVCACSFSRPTTAPNQQSQATPHTPSVHPFIHPSPLTWYRACNELQPAIPEEPALSPLCTRVPAARALKGAPQR